MYNAVSDNEDWERFNEPTTDMIEEDGTWKVFGKDRFQSKCDSKQEYFFTDPQFNCGKPVGLLHEGFDGFAMKAVVSAIVSKMNKARKRHENRKHQLVSIKS